MAHKIMEPKDIIKRVDKLKGERHNWESLWQDLADFFLPRANNITKSRIDGEDLNIELYDSTGIGANELLASALHSFLTNPETYWHEFTTGDTAIDKREDVQKFFSMVQERSHSTINGSNFNTEVHELYLDLGAFGTSAMFVEDDDDTVVRFTTRFIAELFAVENSKGVVSEVYLKFQRTARQIVEQYGQEKAFESKKVKAAFEKDKDDKFDLIQAVYPLDYSGEMAKSFKYISQHILVCDKIDIKKAGFKEFPALVPRWSKASGGEVYGRSPGMKVLADMKTLNIMTQTTLEGAQKIVDPPMQAPDDGFLSDVNTFPGGITYYRPGTQDFIRPVLNDARVDFGFQSMERQETKVKEGFYTHLFTLPRGGANRTATEASIINREQLRMLGPMVGRMQTEFLAPLIDRVIAIMFRKGIIKINEVPDILRNRRIIARYSSFISKAQRLGESENILTWAQAASPFFQFDEGSKDIVDAEGTIRELARVHGVGGKVFRTADEVKQVREAKAQAQEQIIKEQQAAQAAQTANVSMQGMAASAQAQKQGV